MSRISCNVTKDLLPSYLDEICSKESGELVEEHLLECPSCRRFMAELQERDRGKDAPEVNALKKVRRFMDIQSLIAILCPLVLVVTGLGFLHRSNYNVEFCYVTMPLLMLVSAFVLGEGRGKSAPEKKEWLFPVFAALLAVVVLGLRYWACAYIYDIMTASEEYMGNVGSLTHGICIGGAWAAFALLAVLTVYAKKKGKVFPVSMNLAYLTINVVLTLDFSLFNMSDPESLQRYYNKTILILGAEFAVVTALLLVLRGLRSRGEKVG